jgi:hypothetical protein
MSFWMLGQHKNNRTYFLNGFIVDNGGAIWTPTESKAQKFDSRSYAIKFKNTYFAHREEIFIVNREDPTF